MSLRGAHLRYSMSASRISSYGRADALALTRCLFAASCSTPIQVLSLERSPLRNGFGAKEATPGLVTTTSNPNSRSFDPI